MFRTTTLVLLVTALAVTVIGCEKKVDERKNDVPVTGSSDTKGKSKAKNIEAGVQYPPQ